ncbi:hypothetical protein HanIR_Chr05g0251601 [Helianthus annuus]|nr:hypothetical protein HanIR_Chr05g0251601 [Helianthus annuus]
MGSSPSVLGSAPLEHHFPPTVFVLGVEYGTLEPIHKKTKTTPSPLSHTYTYNIYIYILGSFPHFHTSILFASSSHPSYVSDHPPREDHHHTA